MEVITNKKNKRTPYGKFGVIGTLIWIFTLIVIVVYKGQNPLFMELSEFGDFLAGVVGPIAFLWLVLGFYQQREELSINTEALQLQARDLAFQTYELRKSVQQQEIIAKSSQDRFSFESRRAHIAWQPKLVVQYYVHPLIAVDHISHALKIKNMGHLCTEIKFRIESINPVETVETTKPSLSHLNYEDEVIFRFKTSIDPGNMVNFFINYLDGSLTKQSCRYEILHAEEIFVSRYEINLVIK